MTRRGMYTIPSPPPRVKRRGRGIWHRLSMQLHVGRHKRSKQVIVVSPHDFSNRSGQVKKYQYLQMGIFDDIEAKGTDAQTLKWIAGESARLAPGCRVETLEFQGNMWLVRIKNLHSRAHEVLWWIVRELCTQGYEPFTAPNGYHFRRESITD